MKYLVVIAHPLADSLCHAFAQQAIDTLQTAGHEVIIQDLYTMQFKPELSAAERASYYAALYDSQAVKDETQALLAAEGLVLCFPTWWFNFPAILKGWFDRVWAPSIAYHHANDLSAIKPNLFKLQKVVVITTLGSPWWVDKFIMLSPVKRILKIALLGTCAPNAKLTMLSLYKSEKVEAARVQAFKQKITQALQH